MSALEIYVFAVLFTVFGSLLLLVIVVAVHDLWEWWRR